MATLSFLQPLRELRHAVVTDVIIDLGTSNTIIYVPGRGIVLNEPSVVAIDNRTNQIMIAGHDAKMVIGREPQTVRIVRPIRDGVIADFDAAKKMLAYFMKLALGHHRLLNQRVILSAAGDLTPVERRALEDAAYRAGAKRVEIVEGPTATAAGAGYEKGSGKTFMLIDIGGGKTDIAVLSCGGAVHTTTLRTGGNAMDKAITDFLRYKRGIEIGELTAEAIKYDLSSSDGDASEHKIEVRGRNAESGLPDQITVTRSEVKAAIEPVINEIMRAVHLAIEDLPPEVSADLIESGITLSGGVSQISGLRERLKQEASLEVRLAPDPFCGAALGAGRLMQLTGQARGQKTPAGREGKEFLPARAA